MEINTVVLEDNIRYFILKEIENEENRYVYLVNVDDAEDFCIRKIKEENGKEFLVGLDSEAEFEKLVLIFAKEING